MRNRGDAVRSAPGVDGLRRLGNGRAVIYDIKGMFPKDAVDAQL
jgi:hypothetical protein